MPTYMPTGYCGDYQTYQFPSKYGSILNRETPFQPCERPCQPLPYGPCYHERTGYPCPCPTGTDYQKNTWWGLQNNTLNTCSFRPTCEQEYYTLKCPIRCYENGQRSIWLCFDLHEYKPEEICCTLNKTERSICLEATCENKEYNVSRRYFRKFVLPEYLNKIDLGKCELKCYYDSCGFCYVECMLPKLTVEEYSQWPQNQIQTPQNWWFNPMNNNNYFGGWNNWNNWNTWNNRPWPTTFDNSKPVNCKVC